MEAIASRLEAIATSVEAIPSKFLQLGVLKRPKQNKGVLPL